jgi:hypothetical protein
MPQVGLKLTIPVLERAKTVHALDGAAIVIGNVAHRQYESETQSQIYAV